MSVGSSSLLGGRYRLEERAAVGGMGEIWRARDMVLDRAVAVKLPSPAYADDPEFRHRFRLEARHAAAVGHPNIANVFDFGEGSDTDPPFLVMELVDGEPLSAVIARDGPLPAGRLLDVLAQVATALQAAHSVGLVHRDVKPGNLLVRPDGSIKVTDFGIARAVGAAPATSAGGLLGTAQYLSPEQVDGWVATPASDLYSLGVVAYEGLTGRRPFEGEPLAVALAHRNDPPPPLPPSVPEPLAALVMRLLEKDPARRPASALAVAEESRRIAAAGLPPAHPVEPPDAARSVAPPGAPGRIRTPAHLSPRAPAPRAPWLHSGHQLRNPRLLMIGAVAAVVIALIAFGVSAGGGGATKLRTAAAPVRTHRTRAAGTPKRTAQPSTSSALAPVHPVSVSLFEPNGGDDDPSGVNYADDGSLATAWRTEWYATASFGNLKPGVGLIFDLGRPVAVRQVQIALLDAGTGVQLWAGEDPTDLLHSSLVASWAAAPGSVEDVLRSPVTARYWLVFLNHLPDTSVGYASGIREVSFAD